MVEITNGCKVRCDECDKEFLIDLDCFDVESELVEDHDNGMGEEIEHLFSASVSCPECNEGVEVSISVFEYPIGDIETVQVNAEGCTVIQEPNFHASIE